MFTLKGSILDFSFSFTARTVSPIARKDRCEVKVGRLSEVNYIMEFWSISLKLESRGIEGRGLRLKEISGILKGVSHETNSD